MPSSYPFLNIARQIGFDYCTVLTLADILDKLPDSMLEQCTANDGLMVPPVASAVLNERLRRRIIEEDR